MTWDTLRQAVDTCYETASEQLAKLDGYARWLLDDYNQLGVPAGYHYQWKPQPVQPPPYCCGGGGNGAPEIGILPAHEWNCTWLREQCAYYTALGVPLAHFQDRSGVETPGGFNSWLDDLKGTSWANLFKPQPGSPYTYPATPYSMSPMAGFRPDRIAFQTASGEVIIENAKPDTFDGSGSPIVNDAADKLGKHLAIIRKCWDTLCEAGVFDLVAGDADTD